MIRPQFRMERNQKLLQLAQELDRDLRSIREMLRKPVEAEFARGGLTGPQRAAMQILVHSSDNLSLKELSRQLGLSHSTVSGIIDRLEKQGMVERQQNETDGRFTIIKPSKQVREYVRDTLPGVTIHPLIEALRRARPSERAAIREGVKTLRRIVGETTSKSA